MNFQQDYPFRTQKIEFKTPIDFLLFNKNGRIDIFSLFGEDLSFKTTIKNIIERLIFLRVQKREELILMKITKIDIYLRKSQ